MTTRRWFLRGAGAAVALPLLASLAARTGAQALRAPKRLLVLYLPSHETEDFLPGLSKDNVAGSYGDRALGAADFAGKYTEPLALFSADLSILHNLRGPSQHNLSHSAVLTGRPNDTTDSADFSPSGGPSIDWYVANRLASATPIRALSFTTTSASRASQGVAVMSWNDDGSANPPIASAAEGFETVFGAPGGMTSSDQERERRTRLRKSVLDALISDYQSLNQRLGVSDRRLLDQHLGLLREQEANLQAAANFSCDSGGVQPAGDLDIPTTLHHHIDTVVGAFRCDATRVATIGFGEAQDDRTYTFLGQTAHYHNEIAHGNDREKTFVVRQWHAQNIAYALEQLKSVVEADGSTLLSNTLVLVVPELGLFPTWGLLAGDSPAYAVPPDGDVNKTTNVHIGKLKPAIVAGGCQGYLKTGRVIDMEQDNYQNLLVTVAHAMGFEDLASFGEEGTGRLARLLA